MPMIFPLMDSPASEDKKLATRPMSAGRPTRVSGDSQAAHYLLFFVSFLVLVE